MRGRQRQKCNNNIKQETPWNQRSYRRLWTVKKTVIICIFRLLLHHIASYHVNNILSSYHLTSYYIIYRIIIVCYITMSSYRVVSCTISSHISYHNYHIIYHIISYIISYHISYHIIYHIYHILYIISCHAMSYLISPHLISNISYHIIS